LVVNPLTLTAPVVPPPRRTVTTALVLDSETRNTG
jgi:hypothetical protein